MHVEHTCYVCARVMPTRICELLSAPFFFLGFFFISAASFFAFSASPAILASSTACFFLSSSCVPFMFLIVSSAVGAADLGGADVPPLFLLPNNPAASQSLSHRALGSEVCTVEERHLEATPAGKQRIISSCARVATSRGVVKLIVPH